MDKDSTTAETLIMTKPMLNRDADDQEGCMSGVRVKDLYAPYLEEEPYRGGGAPAPRPPHPPHPKHEKGAVRE